MGGDPLSIKDISKILEIKENKVEQLLEEMIDDLIIIEEELKLFV